MKNITVCGVVTSPHRSGDTSFTMKENVTLEAAKAFLEDNATLSGVAWENFGAPGQKMVAHKKREE